jgi:hypothetical protein
MSNAKWYKERYLSNLQKVHNEKWARRRAFEMTEEQLKSEFGMSRYKNYDSFCAADRRRHYKNIKQ